MLERNTTKDQAMVTAYALVAINIISIFICYDIAKRRGAKRRGGKYPLLGLDGGVFFGPLALPFALLCKPKKRD